MGNYSVPEDIRKLKPVGTIVKKIRNQYYVYSHSQSKDESTGKWKTNPGKLLGKIVPEVGYIPNDDLLIENSPKVFDYGGYFLACKLAKDDFELLKKCINAEEAIQIFSLACIFLMEGYIGLVPAASIYQRTLFAHDYTAIKFTYHRMCKLISALGRSDAFFEFQKICMQDASEIAIDGHVIPSDSDKNDLSFNGYKAKQIKSEQMNLLVALDINSHLPVATRVFPGYMVDKTDFKEFVRFLGPINDKLFLMDSGFYSSENIDYLIENGADYIMPLSSNLRSYKEVALSAKKRGRNAQFIYTVTKGKTDFVEYHEFVTTSGKRTIYYCNITEREKLMREYLEKIENGAKGYTQAGLKKGMQEFGVVILETSLTKEKANAKDIYNHYKNRWQIETYYDRIKNTVNFEEINLSEYGMVQGIAFVMMLTGRMDQRIVEVAKKLKMNSADLVREMKALKLLDNGKSTSLCNVKKEHMTIANVLGITYNTCSHCLD